MKLFKPKRATRSGAASKADSLFVRLGLIEDRAELIRQIGQGFPAAVVERLADELQIPQQRLLKIARIASATLTRRRKRAGGRLSPEESDRIYRICDAFADTLRLFEQDTSAAQRWLVESAKTLAALELLVHLHRTQVFSHYLLFTLTIPGRSLLKFDERALPVDWRRDPPPSSTAAIGDEWVTSQQSLALSVPSTLVPRERYLLLNPAHPDYAAVLARAEQGPFDFDERLAG